MDDYKRFFRYVIPGLIFIIELSIYIFLSDNQNVKGLIKGLVSIQSKDVTASIGTAIAAFLATGGLGYIFGTIYHNLFHLIRSSYDYKWARWMFQLLGVDHRSALIHAMDNKWLIIRKFEKGNEIVESNKLRQSGAWRLVTSFWNERLTTSDTIKGAHLREASLADILHGTGTNLIAAFIAGPTSAWLMYHYDDASCVDYKIVAAYFAFLLIHGANYLFVVRDYEGVINANVLHAMKLEAEKKPIVLLAAKNDYKS